MRLPCSASLTTSGEKHPWLQSYFALTRMPLRKSCGSGSILGWRLAISASTWPHPRLGGANWPACLSLWRPLMGVFGSPKITASSSQESLATRYLPNRAVAQDQGLQESEGVYQANIKCQCSFRHQASMD